MSFFVTWLTADRVIAEKEFDDLFKAEDYVCRYRHRYRDRGATAARVWNGRATYFQIEWGGGADQKPVIH
jgi:hypothetical protein